MFYRFDGFRNCPFGSTSVRTVPLTKKDEPLMPGPADYHKIEAKSNDRPSHTFISHTKRLHSPLATVGFIHEAHIITLSRCMRVVD